MCIISCSSPILAVAEYKYEIYFDGTLVPVCWTQADKFWPALFFILTVSIFFFLPLAILVILYTVIARTLMEHPNIIAPPKSNLPPSQNALKYRKQVVLMLGTVVLAFFICLLPFKALTLWIVVVNDDSISNLGMEGYYILLYFCRIMFYLNSAVNPILYNVMSSKFRNGFLRLCGYKFKRKKRRNRTDSGRKTTNTSSTHTSSQNTSDSFWSRYSHRNNSARKEQKDKIDEICNIEGTTVKNNNKDADVFMKMSRKNVNDRLGKIRSIRGESFV